MKGEPTKADVLQYLTCWLCKGAYRDAHTINECMCTCKNKLTYQLDLDCKGCIYTYFTEVPNRNKCPQCQTELGGKPMETLVRDMTLQNIVDWLIPDFKERDDKLKS
jgi:predicted Zn-ribbon and HTH transcriptional regulator